jgi:GNAT superfamily N-acetyltransferase
VIFLALVNEHAIGFAQLYPCFSSVLLERLWVLNDLFVMARARRRRVGTDLVEAARQHAEKTSSKGLVLETKRDNVWAQQLYERLG